MIQKNTTNLSAVSLNIVIFQAVPLLAARTIVLMKNSLIHEIGPTLIYFH